MNANENSNLLFKNNEEKLHSLLQSIPDMLFLFTPDGTITAYHSMNNEKLFLPQDRIIGANIKDIPLQKKYIDEIFIAVEETLKTGDIVLVNYSSSFNEQTFYYEARIIANNQNEIFAIIKEITDIVEIENSFYKNLDTYQENFSSITGAVIITNEVGEITFWNEIASETFNIQKENAIGKIIYNIINSQEFKIHFENYLELFHQNEFDDDITDEFELNLQDLNNNFSKFIFNLSEVRLSEKQHILIMVKQFSNTNLNLEKNYLQNKDNQKFSIAIKMLLNLNFNYFDEIISIVLFNICTTLNIERSGIWLFNDDNTLLINKGTWIKSKNNLIIEKPFEVTKIKSFIDFFSNNRNFAIENIIEDERLDCIEDYLHKNYIFSLLISSIKVDGKTIGIISQEQIDNKKLWSNQEIEFASSVADIISSYLEIKLRKDADEKLIQANSLIKHLFDLSPYGIIIIDGNGEIVNINKKVIDFFCIPEDLYNERNYYKIGNFISESIGLNNENNILKYILETRKEKSSDSFKTKDGKVIEYQLSPFLNNENQFNGAIIFLDDISRFINIM